MKFNKSLLFMLILVGSLCTLHESQAADDISGDKSETFSAINNKYCQAVD